MVKIDKSSKKSLKKVDMKKIFVTFLVALLLFAMVLPMISYAL